MRTRRDLLATATLCVLAGCSGDDGTDGTGDGGGAGYGGGAGDGPDGSGTDVDTADGGAGPSLSSSAFDAGTTIPTKYTCDGADVSPPLTITGTPDGAGSLALVVDDPDAPTAEPFVHWLLWNLPPDVDTIPEGVPPNPTVAELDGAVQGTNGFGDVGYGGPCPPADDGPHTYRFTLYALETDLELEGGADRATFDGAAESHVVGETTITASYGRA